MARGLSVEVRWATENKISSYFRYSTAATCDNRNNQCQTTQVCDGIIIKDMKSCCLPEIYSLVDRNQRAFLSMWMWFSDLFKYLFRIGYYECLVYFSLTTSGCIQGCAERKSEIPKLPILSTFLETLLRLKTSEIRYFRKYKSEKFQFPKFPKLLVPHISGCIIQDVWDSICRVTSLFLWKKWNTLLAVKICS